VQNIHVSPAAFHEWICTDDEYSRLLISANETISELIVCTMYILRLFLRLSTVITTATTTITTTTTVYCGRPYDSKNRPLCSAAGVSFFFSDA